jgi:ribosome-associated protein
VDDLLVGPLTIPGEQLEERFDTPGGPGGQHANRTASAVTLRFDIAGSTLPADIKERLIGKLGESVEVRAAESRSQSRNRQAARERLAGRIEAALLVPKPRKKTRPSKPARERRLAEKRRRSEVKKTRGRHSDED